MEKIAVIRVRGIRSMDPKIKLALEYLKLYKSNHCVVLDATPQNLGAIKKVRDYVTYGAIDDQTFEKLLYKRGEKGGKLLRNTGADIKKVAKDDIDPVFRLHPPRGGYKNIKSHFPRGDLGKRDNVNELIRRMI